MELEGDTYVVNGFNKQRILKILTNREQKHEGEYRMVGSTATVKAYTTRRVTYLIPEIKACNAPTLSCANDLLPSNVHILNMLLFHTDSPFGLHLAYTLAADENACV